jgi:hypothetical protein
MILFATIIFVLPVGLVALELYLCGAFTKHA